MIGMTLDGRYLVVSLLGEGGMGKVYLAEHVMLGKRMAVKVLHEEYSRQEEVVKRFQQEAIAASQIGQENIVNVTDFGRTAEGALFFVMEELRGESLAAALRAQGCFPAQRALPIWGQICRALAAAHDRGIVHRDLKPENVVLIQKEDRPDFVKVLDFGVSKVGAAEHGQEKLTRVGTVMGTPEYMAPEQAAGTKVDHRVDIYSLGVMAYEMMTGVLPFTGDNPLAILLKHQAEAPVPPSQRRPDLAIDADIESLILSCMAKVPDERPRNMAEVTAAINGALQARGMRPLALTPGATPIVSSIGGRLSPAGGTPRVRSGTMQLDSSPSMAAAALSHTPKGGTMQLAAQPGTPSRPIQLVTPAGSSAPGPRPSSAALEAADLAADLAAVKRGPGKGVFIGGGVAVLAVVAFGVGRAMTPAHAVAPAPVPLAASVAPTLQVNAPAAAAPVVAAANPSPPAPPPPPAAQAPKLATVSLRSTPAGARVYEGNVELGQTPLDVEIRGGAITLYRFSLSGYHDASKKVTSDDKAVEVVLVKAKAARTHARKAKGGGSADDDELKDDPFH